MKQKNKNASLYVATFDMQAILKNPCSLVTELYYARKLCSYKLTIYFLGNGQAVCHLRDKNKRKRGSNDIASCLLKNSESVCTSNPLINEITITNSCSLVIPKWNVTVHVHGAIELAKKNTSLFVPSEWSTIVCLAIRSNKYDPVPLKNNHVIDFKSFVHNCSLN